MLAALGAGLIASAVLGVIKLAVGLAIGGSLALFNYSWLVASVRGIIAEGPEAVSRWTSAKFVLRWIIIGIIGYGAYLTHLASPAGILAGLLAPAAAVLIEAIHLTYVSFSQHEA